MGKKTLEQLSDELYYHGYLPRHDVEQLLQKEGDFLVRTVETDASGQKKHVVSVFWQGEHKHILIKRTKTKGTYYIKLYEFDDIPKLIRFYNERAMPVNERSRAKLLTSIPRQEWELLHDQIKLKKKIGEGAYGAVHLGTLRLSRVQILPAAIKLHHMESVDQLAAKAQLDEIMREARLLRQYEHENIVRFYGVAAKEQPLMIVMELVRGGGLDKFVKKFALKLISSDRISFSLDAARGLQYLHSKNCIHRDIAARNCLISRDYQVKISDFGLSQEVQGFFHQADSTKVPIRWLAPEVFKDMTYTQKTDVYSYSILLYEIFTDGGFPYKGMNGAAVKKHVSQGKRLELPSETPKKVVSLIERCWDQDSDKRPSFIEIVQELEEMFSDELQEDIKMNRKGVVGSKTKLKETFLTELDKDKGSKGSGSGEESKGNGNKSKTPETKPSASIGKNSSRTSSRSGKGKKPEKQ